MTTRRTREGLLIVPELGGTVLLPSPELVTSVDRFIDNERRQHDTTSPPTDGPNHRLIDELRRRNDRYSRLVDRSHQERGGKRLSELPPVSSLLGVHRLFHNVEVFDGFSRNEIGRLLTRLDPVDSSPLILPIDCQRQTLISLPSEQEIDAVLDLHLG